MISLLRKEIRSYLSSVIGYVVICVFLLLSGLFMWAFQGNLNTLDKGYSDLDTLFYIAPWVFMFLIPAITMRSFSEEKRTGTIEMLLTKPITDMQIVSAKFFAGLILVAFSLLPTLVYFVSIYFMGNPIGNIDLGATFGSYLGLLFLGAGYTAIGIFGSSLSDNQVVAFITSLFITFFCFFGFGEIGSLSFFGYFGNSIINLGINEHYVSMSRGVIDTRDVVYFICFVFIFLLFTKTVLQTRKW
jgi:ABC-2 type transport system permease protein